MEEVNNEYAKQLKEGWKDFMLNGPIRNIDDPKTIDAFHHSFHQGMAIAIMAILDSMYGGDEEAIMHMLFYLGDLDIVDIHTQIIELDNFNKKTTH